MTREITPDDARMIAHLWDYACSEPDLPAANPVMMWFERLASNELMTDALNRLSPGAWTWSIPITDDGTKPGAWHIGESPWDEVYYEAAAVSEDGRPWYIATVDRGDDGEPTWFLLGQRDVPAHGGPMLIIMTVDDVNDARGISRRVGILPDERRITLAEAAELLDLAPRTLRIQAQAGKLEATRRETPRGPIWLTTPAAVERYRERHRGRVGQRTGSTRG